MELLIALEGVIDKKMKLKYFVCEIFVNYVTYIYTHKLYCTITQVCMLSKRWCCNENFRAFNFCTQPRIWKISNDENFPNYGMCMCKEFAALIHFKSDMHIPAWCHHAVSLEFKLCGFKEEAFVAEKGCLSVYITVCGTGFCWVGNNSALYKHKWMHHNTVLAM